MYHKAHLQMMCDRCVKNTTAQQAAACVIALCNANFELQPSANTAHQPICTVHKRVCNSVYSENTPDISSAVLHFITALYPCNTWLSMQCFHYCWIIQVQRCKALLMMCMTAVCVRRLDIPEIECIVQRPVMK
jgi:hypothetical protein